MVLEQVTHSGIQLQDIARLEQVLRENDLNSELIGFLLTLLANDSTPATIAGYKGKLSLFIRFATQTLKITDPAKINVNHIRLFFIEKQKTCNGITINDHYRALRRFFNWMIEERKLTTSPMASIKPPKQPKYLIKPFSINQIVTLLEMCDDSQFIGARNRAIILVFMDTGLRLSELTHIKLEDVDLKKETIRVMGKGNKERIVRIGKVCQKALIKYTILRHCELSSLWLTEERKPMSTWGVQIMIRRLGKRAGLTGVRCSPHTFRHFFGTQSLKNGANVYDVQSLLGHSTLDMTKKYVQSLTSEDAVVNHQRFSPADRLMRE